MWVDILNILGAELTNLRKKVNEFEAEKKIYHRILQSHGLLSEDQVCFVLILQENFDVCPTHFVSLNYCFIIIQVVNFLQK